MDSQFSDRRSAAHAPQAQLRAMFESEMKARAATILSEETLQSDPWPEVLQFLETILVDESDDSGGGLAVADPSFIIEPLALASKDDDAFWICATLRTEEGRNVLLSVVENVPIMIEDDSGGAMVVSFTRIPEIPESAPMTERFRIGFGHLLTDAAHELECARVLNQDLSGYYGRSLCELLESSHMRQVDPSSITRAEHMSQTPNRLVIRFTASGGTLVIAEFGMISGTVYRHVPQMTLFPKEGVSLQGGARTTPQSEALVTEFPSFYPGDVAAPDTSAQPVIDEAIVAGIQEHLQECFFQNWDPSWSVVVTATATPAAMPGFCAFARVVDSQHQSVIPNASAGRNLDPLYCGFAIGLIETGSEEDLYYCVETHGFVLTQDFLHRDLETLCSTPEKSLFGLIIYQAVEEALVGQGLLQSGNENQISLGTMRAIYLTTVDQREIYAIHVTHDFGEHVLYLSRNIPTGLIRLGCANPELQNYLNDTDIGIRYFVPASTFPPGAVLPDRPASQE
ncbi:MAG: hypothetical protein J0M12_06030 [Deltaproteobacteria bacterium]|nr:hypothetical protein [Deltaproteobacteria bacterium]